MTEATDVRAEPFRIHSYEVDPHGFAPISTLCNYLQEAAGNHARDLGFSCERLLDLGLAWVLGTIHVEIDRYPQWGETVTVETWHSGLSGIYTNREFLLLNESGACIGRATSKWLILNVERRRIARPPRDLYDVPACSRGRVLPDAFDDAPDEDVVADDAAHQRRFPVRFSDLDLNQHVNNVRYAEWALEAIPETFQAEHRLAEIELQFRAESTLGDTIVTQSASERVAPPSPASPAGRPEDRTSTSSPSRSHGFLHLLKRDADARTLAFARTRWTALDATTATFNWALT